MTIDEAIAILRQHNTTGASVMRITGGRALEQELLAQVLDRCEQNEAELKEAKRLLKCAIEDIKPIMEFECYVCALQGKDGFCSEEDEDEECADVCKWRYTDEALKLIGGVTDET